MEATRRTDLLRASPRMFENDLLDKLSRVHPAVPVIIFVPAVVVLIVLAAGGMSAPALIGLFLAGYLFWTLAEYWIHRVIFHFEPEDGFGARLHWIIHGVHHDHPNDPLRLALPPPRGAPRPPERPAGARHAAVGERPAVVAVRPRLLRDPRFAAVPAVLGRLPR